MIRHFIQVIKKYRSRAFWATFISISCNHLSAEVITDGSVGAQVSLQGTDYDISADLGLQQGSNLFHSFDTFNLQNNETATFSGSENIKNIVARITGGQSTINGLIRTTIPEADLYLANTQGFVFENNARLDVLGSFYLTTASSVFFADGQVLSTRQTNKNQSFSSAPPAAFGFLDTPHSIEISGTQLDTLKGKTLSLSAGDIVIKNSRLKATAGHLDLLSIRHGSPVNPIVPFQETFELGSLTMSNNSTLDIGRDGDGIIFIRAGDFTVENSSIFVNTSIIGQNSLLFINTNNLLLNNVNLDSRTYGAGQGGLIIVQVKQDATLIDSNILTTGTQKEPEITGDAGDIRFIAENLTLLNTSITTKTYGIGMGGDISIFVRKNLYMASPKVGLGISPSVIQASTEDGGDAGRIYIEARNLTLTGENTAIDNNSTDIGNGGSIQLHIADVLALSDSAFISADSTSRGNAGSISLNSSGLFLQDSTISTAASESDGGNIVLNVRSRLNLTNSAISANINGDGLGNGGNLAIGNACTFQLQDSELSANARFGNGGSILAISGAGLDLMGNSKIDASSEFGTDGSVQIEEIPSIDRTTLSIQFLDASMKIKQRCITRTDDNVSHFSVKQKTDLPNVPDDFQSYIPLLYNKSL
ncbi:filamentous hemagglutinin N-terminal domain-containing protein [Candidatus Albibeggiatoa sp. nov. NOAA]|uniref:two-partner secretion domain-containing protein n=1 Tax=Candidatus Albibeggiatoa sp. nov. NOAA TaxID=3162724 RepID=UPI0032FD354A|nr:filamentous hemagglutinin N-terminal domain-containing protein [Thiotrichaceae bacterium]